MADLQTAGSPTLNDASALDKASGAPSTTAGDTLPPKPTVEDEPVGEKPLDTAASIPSTSIKPDLPPAEAVPKPAMNEVNGDTKMVDPSTSEAPLEMAGALQGEPPKPAGTDIVAPVPVKEDSLVKDVVKDDAPVAEKPAETKPLDELPERPSAPGPEAAQEPVQDPAAEAFKPEMEASTNGKAENTESAPKPSVPDATIAAPAPATEEPSTEAAEEAKLDAMPALAAEPPVVGEKRAADQTEPHADVNGGSDAIAAPAAKKQKVDNEANGGVKKSNSKAKKDKKPPPTVGRTARKTRSQGAA